MGSLRPLYSYLLLPRKSDSSYAPLSEIDSINQTFVQTSLDVLDYDENYGRLAEAHLKT